MNKIYEGDALQVLKTFPDESVNCVLTSPPYWALRDYGKETLTIFDEVKDCVHSWGDNIPGAGKNNDKTAGIIQQGNKGSIGRDDRNNSNFCVYCGAWKGQLGLEPSFDLYIKHLCDIFDQVKRVLRKDGTCWVNIGDTYIGGGEGGSKYGGQFGSQDDDTNPANILNRKECLKANNLQSKSLCCIPFRFAIEMQNRGWILRNTIIWHKPNCMPSSVKDRFTVDFEYIFLFVKNKKYYFEPQREGNSKSKIFNIRVRDVKLNRIKSFDRKANEVEVENYQEGYRELIGRNKRSVWSICPKPFKEAHFAVYPEALCEIPIKAGCPEYVCKKCGKPRIKIIEKKIMPEWRKNYVIKTCKIEKGQGGNFKNSTLLIGGDRYNKWKQKNPDVVIDASCSCNAGFMPGIVLDPFLGAGTTALVALKQNKNFIGIDLNPEYVKMAYKRLKPFLTQKKLDEVV